MARRRVTDAGRDAAEDVRFHVLLCQRGNALFDCMAVFYFTIRMRYALI